MEPEPETSSQELCREHSAAFLFIDAKNTKSKFTKREFFYKQYRKNRRKSIYLGSRLFSLLGRGGGAPKGDPEAKGGSGYRRGTEGGTRGRRSSDLRQRTTSSQASLLIAHQQNLSSIFWLQTSSHRLYFTG